MHGRFFCVFIVLLAGAAACRRHVPVPDGAGTLVLERTAPDSARLGELPVRARYCGRDSLLSIVGFDASWSAALALRTTWPSGSLHFTLDTLPAGIGTAAFAARQLRDSIGAALVSSGGRVDLDSGGVLAGHFTADTGHDSTRVSLSGRFEGMRPDTNGCAAAGGG